MEFDTGSPVTIINTEILTTIGNSTSKSVAINLFTEHPTHIKGLAIGNVNCIDRNSLAELLIVERCQNNILSQYLIKILLYIHLERHWTKSSPTQLLLALIDKKTN